MAKVEITPEVAAERVLQRRRMRASLAEWAQVAGFVPAKHHKFLIAELEKIASGESKRLMVFMPPGSAKSTYSSVIFPAWFLARHPDKSIIAASNTQELADSFGRRVRNLVLEHRPKLGIKLSSDSLAAGRWALETGGEYYSAGVGGTITGRRADVALIDDPIRSREDADSELVRNRQWEWYRFDLLTRLKPDASIILILTRWHEDDLAGRILAEEADKWRVVRLPMEAEENDPLGRAEGELLWPEWFKQGMADDAKRDPRVWSALYQQRPAPESGGFFKREWFVGYSADQLPNNLSIYAASDHAIGEKQTNDRTALVVAGLDEAGVMWILPDIRWSRMPGDEQVAAMVEMMQRRKPITWFAEKGHITKALGPFLNEHMRAKGAYAHIEQVTPIHDKLSRAQSFRARMSMGMVRWPKFCPWYANAEAEFLSFPAGKHDDLVDACSHLGMGVDRMVTPAAPKAPPELEAFFSQQSSGSLAGAYAGD